MSKRFDRQAFTLLVDTLMDKGQARRFTLSRKALLDLLHQQGWPEKLARAEAWLPELDGAKIAILSSDVLAGLSPAPAEGWTGFSFRYAVDIAFPDPAFAAEREAYGNGAVFFLALYQTLLTLARSRGLIRPELDISLLRDGEVASSEYEEEYRRFRDAYKYDFVYELMRLGGELTPYKTLEHICGVHHLALSLASQMRASGGPVDIGLASAAAAVHDLGKYGCKDGERVPHLHYYYTEVWCKARNLPAIGHIAANHSAWDLELENLSAESLLLIYADFRVKQLADQQGGERTAFYSLAQSFDVILAKLDQVDAEKLLRYRFIHAKLKDFEDYLGFLGVDVTLAGQGRPRTELDIPLMDADQVVEAFKRLSIGHSLELMHRFGAERLFGNILEAARSEKNWKNLRAYIGVVEQYSHYLNANQKLQTLDFLYEQLFHREGDIRRQAGSLLGAVIAHYEYGYRKELPGSGADEEERRQPLQLWQKYLAMIVHPDHKQNSQDKSWIGFSLRSVASALLAECRPEERLDYLQAFWAYFQAPEQLDDFAAFVLMTTAYYLPLELCPEDMLARLCAFTLRGARQPSIDLRVASLRLLCRIASLPRLLTLPACRQLKDLALSYDDGGCAALIFLRSRLLQTLGLTDSSLQSRLSHNALVADIFLENLKMATPWIIKAVNIRLLEDQIDSGHHEQLLHIAAHFSNLVKVSERVVVRHDAGAALVKIAPLLSLDQRNEIAVELAKGLEVGQYEFSKYIPAYLGEFALWLHPRELDELIAQLKGLLSSANDSIASVALDTVAILLECYSVYPERFPETRERHEERQNYLLGILMKGLAGHRPALRQEALLVLGKHFFASARMGNRDQRRLFTLSAKKLLFLISENLEEGLAFYYRAAALTQVYRFISQESILRQGFAFKPPLPVAFFPGTFDPLTLSHKGIIQGIRALGFEVMVAVDEFSWSKNTQPMLMRRQIAVQALADRFHVQIFPYAIPVNLANPADLQRLRSLFPQREIYIVVGSDVVANASSYKAPPVPGSIHGFNHIIFQRANRQDSPEQQPDCLSCIQGRVLHLTLPLHLEDISSSRIRDDIDRNRDITNLVDPMVQEYIYHNGIYLREPQYKPIIRAGAVHFELVEPHLPGRIRAVVNQVLPHAADAESICDELLRRSQRLIVIRNGNAEERAEGFISFSTLHTSSLMQELNSGNLAQQLRQIISGRILLISCLAARPNGEFRDCEQLLLTEALDWALRKDYTFAIVHPLAQLPATARARGVLERQGFFKPALDYPLWTVDMRSPLALIQNLETTIKEPLASDGRVLDTVRLAHQRFQIALTRLFPGHLVLSLSSGIIHHRLVAKIAEMNGVPPYPVTPRILGPNMCMPFGKILRGKAAPNTVTKTLHTDKVFAPDLRSFTIEAYPHYAPLPDQIRIIKSFMRPVIMVDDLLHKGSRIRVIKPLMEQEEIRVKSILVGLLSGRGRDYILESGLNVDSVYYVPNMRGWFVESTMYPFIGGDTVRRAGMKVPGLLPSVNLLLPYGVPPLHQYYSHNNAFELSLTCLSNARDIMSTLETEYRLQFGKNLTLSRLAEGIIRPLCPDRGGCVDYDPNLPATEYLNNDIEMLMRLEQVMK